MLPSGLPPNPSLGIGSFTLPWLRKGIVPNPLMPKPVVYVPIDDDEISRGVIIQVVIGFERYSLIADRTGYRHVMLQLEIGLDLWLGLVRPASIPCLP